LPSWRSVIADSRCPSPVRNNTTIDCHSISSGVTFEGSILSSLVLFGRGQLGLSRTNEYNHSQNGIQSRNQVYTTNEVSPFILDNTWLHVVTFGERLEDICASTFPLLDLRSFTYSSALQLSCLRKGSFEITHICKT